jgi:hypothetical protein
MPSPSTISARIALTLAGAGLLQHLLLLAGSSAVGVARGFVVSHGTRAAPAAPLRVPPRCSRTRCSEVAVLASATLPLALSPPSSAASEGHEVGDKSERTLDSRGREEEAKRLLERAKELRAEAEAASSALLALQRGSGKRGEERSEATSVSSTAESSVVAAPSNPFSLQPAKRNENVGGEDAGHHEYRLHLDIGREPGTWMDRRWGASGRRVEFTLDVRFTARPGIGGDDEDGETGADRHQQAVAPPFGDDDGASRLLRGPRPSEFWALETAPYARMRAGFDRMRCEGGAYRIEKKDPGKGRPQRDGVIRFCVRVEGTADYGDVSIPPGYLYFSLPAFSCHLSRLSRKPGPVTVRQVGWNTGWRREESRIVGVFLATPLESK